MYVNVGRKNRKKRNPKYTFNMERVWAASEPEGDQLCKECTKVWRKCIDWSPFKTFDELFGILPAYPALTLVASFRTSYYAVPYSDLLSHTQICCPMLRSESRGAMLQVATKTAPIHESQCVAYWYRVGIHPQKKLQNFMPHEIFCCPCSHAGTGGWTVTDGDSGPFHSYGKSLCSLDNNVRCTHLFILEVGEFSMHENNISILPALEGGRDAMVTHACQSYAFCSLDWPCYYCQSLLASLPSCWTWPTRDVWQNW